MPYKKLPTYARKDLLTGAAYGQLRTNGYLMERVHGREHLATGEHNTPMVARTLGTVLVAAGPTYSLSGFNSDASLGSSHNPAVGKLVLTLAAGRYEKDRGAIMVQSAGTAGDTRPELVWARWFDDRRVEVFTTYWDTNAWAAGGVDSAFHIGVHGRTLARSTPLDWGTLLQQRANGLRVSSANPLIQASADVQVAMDAAHTDGVHDVREVAKAWAHVQHNGSTYDIADQECSDTFDGVRFTGFDITATGVINCKFQSSLASTGYQVFVDVGYSTNHYICCAPVDERAAGSFKLYFYIQSFNAFFSPAQEEWDPANALDFQVWVYDDH
jgi:hypothetical protein